MNKRGQARLNQHHRDPTPFILHHAHLNHENRPPHQRQAGAGSDYFETINPATQQVLAEVASGGEAEVHAAVAAAKAAFPKWAGTPAPSAPN
jgi:acyl-CoA reductase-like NAD-dependent aldehyde dehydrogenase